MEVPCTSCGAIACSISLPALDGEFASIMRPILAIARLQPGAPQALRSANPFSALDAPTVASLLAVRCATCSAT